MKQFFFIALFLAACSADTASTAAEIRFGDTKGKVVSVLGRPDYWRQGELWTTAFYGNARIRFTNDSVIDWENVGELKKAVFIEPVRHDTSATVTIRTGDTKKSVVGLLGEPDYWRQGELWLTAFYGPVRIRFQNDTVCDWENERAVKNVRFERAPKPKPKKAKK